ncbi:MAG: 2-dehydropantoate 2-reductase [Conexibacter sp.]|nr:2-dehydropantoate 2-reductase [Conexibacter sp.]
MPTSFGILGPGGVGGFLAAALDRSGEAVTVVAREETAALIARDGIELESRRLGDFTARPAATARLTEPVDVLFVATKAAALEQALTRIEADPGVVVPLLNGLDHVAVLRERFGVSAVAGTIRIEADRTAPRHVEQTSPFLRIDVASDDPAPRERLAALVGTLNKADVPARLVDGEANVLWSKLLRLNALALTTSAYDLPLGAIRDDPSRRAELEACVDESAAIARAEGAAADPEATLTELDEAHAELGSSMRRDIAAGRTPELDAIAGAVLRAGARHGLSSPTIEALAARVARRAGIPAPRL